MEGKYIADPMRITYMPGGIGAVAYNAIVAQRPAEANTIVAFSGGSLLNLAQGKFGRYNENDVRWLAAVGSDFGAVIVAENSPFKSMKDLVAAVKADPSKVVFGAGGTVGSQDWMKAALPPSRRVEPEVDALRRLRRRRRGHHRAARRPRAGLFRRRVRGRGADQGRRQDPRPRGDVRQAAGRQLPAFPPPRNRASTSSGRSSAASTSARRSATPTTRSGPTPSTR